MWGAIWAVVKIAATGLIWWKQKSDENTGRELEHGAELALGAKQGQQAAAIAERDAALTHTQLVDRVRDQTGSEP